MAPMRLPTALLPLVLCLAASLQSARAAPNHARANAPLPLAVAQALRQAEVPETALGVWVQALDEASPRLQWQAGMPLNPASLAKLATTYAALEQLGPGFTWPTSVWLNGRLGDDGVLDGDLVIKGSGDPKLGTERLVMLLRRLRDQYGLREIRGQVVLDRSAFAPPEGSPADFDAEPWRPANVQSDALLFNYKSLVYTVRPDPARRVATITSDPPLDGPVSVPLAPGVCEDWRVQVRLQWQVGQHPRFDGSYPQGCPEAQWQLADPEPASYGARLLATLWHELGGRLRGGIVDGLAPATPPTLAIQSPPLAELVRDINKNSNNVMAQHLLLTLARPADGTAVAPAAAADWLGQWFQTQIGSAGPAAPWFVNGSGLARETRISAAQLAALLRQAWASPRMPEFVASLPLAGIDGTLMRQPARFGAALGRAHLKTGSLRDVVGLAGYVQSPSGRRWLLVAMVNHARAAAARPALDALVRWVAQDAPPARAGAATSQ